MKRLLIILVLFILNITACQATSNVIADDGSEIETDSDDLEFSDLSDLEFWFGSGAGAWFTTVTIQPDGTFAGYYLDCDMGSRGTDYPNGTSYECNFSGKFSELKKINEYEYSMKCESIITEGIIGQEKIIDGERIITAGPYGFDDADEFIIYLPGKPAVGLPEMFLGWVKVNPEETDTLTFYGLYNVEGEQGFSSYEKD